MSADLGKGQKEDKGLVSPKENIDHGWFEHTWQFIVASFS